MIDLVIERAFKQEAALLSDLSKVTFYDTFVGTCTDEDMEGYLEHYYSEAQLQAELENENDYTYIAYAYEQPIGYIRFKAEQPDFPTQPHLKSIELKRLYIKKEFHGKQVANQLMDLFLQYAKENGFSHAFLGVWEYNFKAQKFYQKYGFQFTGHSHPFPIGNTPQTDLWFDKLL